MVERYPYKVDVGGSSPSTPTRYLFSTIFLSNSNFEIKAVIYHTKMMRRLQTGSLICRRRQDALKPARARRSLVAFVAAAAYRSSCPSTPTRYLFSTIFLSNSNFEIKAVIYHTKMMRRVQGSVNCFSKYIKVTSARVDSLQNKFASSIL